MSVSCCVIPLCHLLRNTAYGSVDAAMIKFPHLIAVVNCALKGGIRVKNDQKSVLIIRWFLVLGPWILWIHYR